MASNGQHSWWGCHAVGGGGDGGADGGGDVGGGSAGTLSQGFEKRVSAGFRGF